METAGQGRSWLGSSTASTHGPHHHYETTGQAGHTPDGFLYGHSSKATSVVWRHRCGQRQTTDAEQCDMEGMAGQADVLRAHSQGVNGAELGLAAGDVQCMTRCVSDQGRTRHW